MRTIHFSDPYGLTALVRAGQKTMTRRETDYDVGEVLAVAERYEDIFSRIVCAENEEAAVQWAWRVLAAHHRDALMAQDIEQLAGWRNKMYVRAELMPMRIVITDKREQHIQDITDEECLLEGIQHNPLGVSCTDNRTGAKGDYTIIHSRTVTTRRDGRTLRVHHHLYPTPRAAFADLINRLSPKINGVPYWAANPVVKAYTFKLVDQL